MPTKGKSGGALKALRIRVKARDTRGTEGAVEVLEQLNENWETIREKFNQSSQQEMDDLIDHFNSVGGDIGDMLFGADSDREEFSIKLKQLSDAQQDQLKQAVVDAELFDSCE